MNDLERFWTHVTKTSSCWLWHSATFDDGYGAFQVKGKARRAHRWLWEAEHGPIVGDLLVCHRCDVPRCVNPTHLFLGTVQDNSDDMVAKNRAARRFGESNRAAKLSAAQVGEIRTKCAQGQTQRSLSLEYGVSNQHVSRIVNRKKWTQH